MKKYILLFFFVSLLCAAVQAQESEITATLDTTKGFVITKIAVEDFTGTGSLKLLPEDSVVLIRLAEVIRNDLGFSPYYDVIELDSFYMRHMELEVMTLLGWSQMGAAYVVKAEGDFAGDNVTLRYQLISTTSAREFARGSFKSLAKNYRYLAHKVSNEIIYYLTGEEGVFDSRISFISNRTGNKEVYLCDYDGANIYRLTGNGSINLSPSFSPDNQDILFTSFMNDDPQLFQYDIRTGDVELLAAYPGINSAARVSPDGNEIACALSRDGNAEIYLLHRNGKIKRRLTYTKSIESAPCWSPSGNKIAFTSDRTGSPQIYIMDKDGVNVTRLTYVGSYNDSPDWSPRGDKIVYVSRVNGKFNICTIDVTGDNYRVLTEKGNNENPHWSPDGNHVIFSSSRTGDQEIYIMDRFGVEERRITTGGGNSNPAWSGKGK